MAKPVVAFRDCFAKAPKNGDGFDGAVGIFGRSLVSCSSGQETAAKSFEHDKEPTGFIKDRTPFYCRDPSQTAEQSVCYVWWTK